jgi:hypothetical protein
VIEYLLWLAIRPSLLVDTSQLGILHRRVLFSASMSGTHTKDTFSPSSTNIFLSIWVFGFFVSPFSSSFLVVSMAFIMASCFDF